MIKLVDLLARAHKATEQANGFAATMLYEAAIFNELANPDWAYPYEQVAESVWQFEDKYGNKIGVEFLPASNYFETFFVAQDLEGREVKTYDPPSQQHNLKQGSITGGTDEHRSDTICKILLEEVLPKYLLSRPFSKIVLHPISPYRYDIFMKCAEVCKDTYPSIEVKPMGKEIMLIHRG